MSMRLAYASAAVAALVGAMGAGGAVASNDRPAVAALREQPEFEVPVGDGAEVIGTLRLRAILGLPSADDVERAEARNFLLRDAQVAALAEWGRTRADPGRAPDADAAARRLEQAVADAGFPRTRVLVQWVRVDIS